VTTEQHSGFGYPVSATQNTRIRSSELWRK